MTYFKLDFGKLAALAKDSRAFEAERKRIISDYINSAPPETQDYLWRCQAEIDARRDPEADPLLNAGEMLSGAMRLCGRLNEISCEINKKSAQLIAEGAAVLKEGFGVLEIHLATIQAEKIKPNEKH